MTASGSSSVFAGFRFPREVIAVAVRWYLRYGLSYRDVEELLAEGGVTVGHVTVYRWVQRFTPEFIEAARPARHAPGDRWSADETYVKVAGRRTYLYRAVDQHLLPQCGLADLPPVAVGALHLGTGWAAWMTVSLARNLGLTNILSPVRHSGREESLRCRSRWS